MDGGGRVLEPLIAGFPGGHGDRMGAARAAAPGMAGSAIPWAALARWVVSPAAALGLRRRSVSVPLAHRLPPLLGTGLTLGFFGAVGIYGLAIGGHYGAVREAVGEPRDIVAKAFGFGLNRITISGLATLSEREVLGAAGISPKVSLPFLGAADIRERLERLPLVRSATVRKLYPNELAIGLVERIPFAIWQKDGDLRVVAADGTAIDALRDPRLAGLPLVVGDMANLRAPEYLALLDAAGPLRSKIRAGMLVSGRRWTLKMANGVDVRLPEQDAAPALARLVRLDREQHILDKDVLAIDLRMPDRVVFRLTEEAAAARIESTKKKLQRGQKGVET